MKIYSICPHSFGSNTYVLVSGNEAAIVDPSVSVSTVEKNLNELRAVPVSILLTHGHFDHTVSVDTLRNKYPIPLIINSADAPMITDGKADAFYAFYGLESTHNPAERLISDSDEIKLGNETIKVIGTPGHSPGSVCFLCNDGNSEFMLTGDTLFADSVGRCDLWKGDPSALRDSLRKLLNFDKSMKIYPGHGGDSTLGSALESAGYYVDF